MKEDNILDEKSFDFKPNFYIFLPSSDNNDIPR